MRRVLVIAAGLLLGVAGGLVIPRGGWAYDCIYLSASRWPGNPAQVDFSVNPNGTTAGDPAGQVDAIERAMGIWNTDGGGGITLSSLGTTDAVALEGSNQQHDDQNVISFYPGASPFNGATVAQTFAWSGYDFATSQWYADEADIILYSQWGDDTLVWYTGVDLPAPEGEVDIETTAAHEMGHAVRLAHPATSIPGALMDASVGAWGDFRSLGAYDEECLQAFYPPLVDPGAEDPPSDDPGDDPPAEDPPADPPADDPPAGDPPTDDPPADDPAASGDPSDSTPADPAADPPPAEDPDPADSGEEEESQPDEEDDDDDQVCYPSRPYLLCVDLSRFFLIDYCDFAPSWDFRCNSRYICDRFPQICRYFQ